MATSEAPLILVVDDTPRQRDLLATFLEREGYQTVLAPDGAQALDFVARVKPDLILLDILMPGLSGLEVCRRLKENPATKPIPIIFLTGRAGSDDILAGFAAGAADYVTKPFRIAELLARVQVHVELRRARLELRTLRGILPTCAHCKKIRGEQGAWQSMESFITERSEARISHGVCPECVAIHYPDFRENAATP